MIQATIQHPSHRLEHRAVGRVCGIYHPSLEMPDQGLLLTNSGEIVSARIIRQGRKALHKLEDGKVYYWSCYPKTSLGKFSVNLFCWNEVPNEYQELFSICGRLASVDDGEMAVHVYRNNPKFRQDQYSEVRIKGYLPKVFLGAFVDLLCCLEGTSLELIDGNLVASAGEFEPPKVPQQQSSPKVKIQTKKPTAKPKPKKKTLEVAQ